jgi:hypothetical protein
MELLSKVVRQEPLYILLTEACSSTVVCRKSVICMKMSLFVCLFHIHFHTVAPISTKFVTMAGDLPGEVLDT